MDNAKYEIKTSSVCVFAASSAAPVANSAHPCQVCCLLGPQDRRPRLRPAGRPGGGESKDGADAVCLPHGPRLEEGAPLSQDVNVTADEPFAHPIVLSSLANVIYPL